MLWGNKDVKSANTGTITISANGYCEGDSTLFQVEAKVGEYLISNSTKYLIANITSNTVMHVAAATKGAAVAAVGATNTYIIQQGPAFVAASEVGANAAEVYGIDATEASVANGSVISIPILSPGSGYTANATLTITGNATGNAQANSTGKISALNITASGNSYTTPPTATISAPAARTFNANTSVASNGFIAFATNVFQNNDKLLYAVAAGNTALAELTNGSYYYATGSNSTGCYLSATPGGSVITLTKGAGETGHSLQGETAIAGQAVISGLAGKIAHAGWVRRVVGTGNRAGRIQYETLVAMGSISGDAEDTVAKDS